MQTLTCELRTLTGESLGVLVLNPKEFKSGKPGYFGQAKVTIGDRRYQCQAQCVAIGPPAGADAESSS